jgi:hypothetical protein
VIQRGEVSLFEGQKDHCNNNNNKTNDYKALANTTATIIDY